MRYQCLRAAAALALSVAVAAAAAERPAAAGAPGALPHIVYFLVDDLGYSNVGFHNDEPITPNIDRWVHALTALRLRALRGAGAPGCRALESQRAGRP